jgi:hypothetical protein
MFASPVNYVRAPLYIGITDRVAIGARIVIAIMVGKQKPLQLGKVYIFQDTLLGTQVSKRWPSGLKSISNSGSRVRLATNAMLIARPVSRPK